MRSVYRSFCAGAFALIAVSASAESTFSLTSLTPDVALKLATAARESCNEQGYQVAVAVVDRSGLLQAFVRDRFRDTAYSRSRRTEGMDCIIVSDSNV
jgi:hypothetical protein